jgi:hypothetical protein
MKRRVVIGLVFGALIVVPTVGGCGASSPDAEQTSADENAVTNDTEDTSEEATTSAAPLSSGVCSSICSFGGIVACNELSGIGGLACGFSALLICGDACSGSERRCTTKPGGRACMTRSALWWCDSKVDGRQVTVQYQLNGSFPQGIVETVAAPRRACQYVRWPSWGQARRFRICVKDEGCGGWVNHP